MNQNQLDPLQNYLYSHSKLSFIPEVVPKAFLKPIPTYCKVPCFFSQQDFSDSFPPVFMNFFSYYVVGQTFLLLFFFFLFHLLPYSWWTVAVSEKSAVWLWYLLLLLICFSLSFLCLYQFFLNWSIIDQ